MRQDRIDGRGDAGGIKPTLLSRRQKWGFDCRSMMAGVVEHGPDLKPVALIDYLHESAPQKSGKDDRYVVLKTLCDNAAIPLIACRYGADFTWFQAFPLNDYAKGLVMMKKTRMDEIEWVRFLYQVRGIPFPRQVESAIIVPPKFETQEGGEQPEEKF